MKIDRVPAAYAREVAAAVADIVSRCKRDRLMREIGASDAQLARESPVAPFMVDPDESGDCVIMIALPNDTEAALSLPLPAAQPLRRTA